MCLLMSSLLITYLFMLVIPNISKINLGKKSETVGNRNGELNVQQTKVQSNSEKVERFVYFN